MKNKKLLFGIAAGVIVLLVACGVLIAIQPTPSTTSSYKNNLYGFTFDYNKNWTIDTDTNKTGQTSTTSSDVVVQVFSDQTVNQFKDNFNIVVNPQYQSTSDITTEADAQVKNIESQSQNFAIVTKEQVTLAGQPAAKVTYTATINGLAVKQTQWYVANAGKLYVMSYTALPDTYDNDSSNINTIVTSFKF